MEFFVFIERFLPFNHFFQKRVAKIYIAGSDSILRFYFMLIVILSCIMTIFASVFFIGFSAALPKHMKLLCLPTTLRVNLLF